VFAGIDVGALSWPILCHLFTHSFDNWGVHTNSPGWQVLSFCISSTVVDIVLLLASLNGWWRLQRLLTWLQMPAYILMLACSFDLNLWRVSRLLVIGYSFWVCDPPCTCDSSFRARAMHRSGVYSGCSPHEETVGHGHEQGNASVSMVNTHNLQHACKTIFTMQSCGCGLLPQMVLALVTLCLCSQILVVATEMDCVHERRTSTESAFTACLHSYILPPSLAQDRQLYLESLHVSTEPSVHLSEALARHMHRQDWWQYIGVEMQVVVVGSGSDDGSRPGELGAPPVVQVANYVRSMGDGMEQDREEV
jgi:hypothetical protein